MIAVAQLVFRLFVSQKIVLLLIGSLAVLLFVFIGGVHLEAKDGTLVSVRVFGSEPIVGEELRVMAGIFTGTFSIIAFNSVLVLSVIASAGLVPEMFASGVMTFLLTRQLSRTQVVLGIFFGIVAAFAMIDMGLVSLFWAALTVKMGEVSFLVMAVGIPLLVAFASVFAAMLLLSVTVKNTGVVTCFGFVHTIAFSNLLAAHESIPTEGIRRVIRPVAEVLYYILPQTCELQKTAQSILTNQSSSLRPIIFSTLSAIIMLTLSSVYFRRRDL